MSCLYPSRSTLYTLFFCLILLATGCIDEDSSNGNLFVTVTNDGGLGVQNAEVNLDPGGFSQVTDSEAAVTFSNIQQGDYNVFAVHPDFGYAESSVRITPGQTRTVNLRLRDTVNVAPTIDIRSPSQLSVSERVEGEPVFFRVRTSDGNGIAGNELVWRSDVSGLLRRSSPDMFGEDEFSVDTLPPGEHFITVTVTDPGGLSAADSVRIRIIERPDPVTLLTVEATSPGPGPRLTWSSYRQEGFRYYEVRRDIEGDGAAERPIASLQNIQDTTFVDPSLNYGESAEYTVFVKTDYGDSEYSNRMRHQSSDLLIPLNGNVRTNVVSEARRELYLLDILQNKIHVVDMTTQEVVAEIPTVSNPNDLVVSPNNDSLYVIGGGSAFIDVIDLTNRASARRINTAGSFGLTGSHQVVFGMLDENRLVVGDIQNRPGLLVISTLNGEVLGEVTDENNYQALDIAGDVVYASSGFGDGALRAYRITADNEFEELSSSASVFSGGLFLKVVDDGASLIHGDRRYRTSDLGVVEGTYNRTIRAASDDGSLAFSNDKFLDGDTYVTLLDLTVTLGPVHYDDSLGLLYALVRQDDFDAPDRIVVIAFTP